ncbi:MAG: hypothetical protein FWF84_05930, partial [Kiritimatiellaeota bacterium]|nr:hypothetical protein [Kiritimatiellota bacterium]
LRPNQLFAITLGALLNRPSSLVPRISNDERRKTNDEIAMRVLQACECLLVPGAMRSLADRPVTYPLPIERNGCLLNDPSNPYWGHYLGDEDTRRKPAYHNGTAWVWPFFTYIEALLIVHGDAAKPTAQAYLGSVADLFNHGAVGHLPEILDGNAPHAQRGCLAQAWSLSEYLRVMALM